MVAPMRRPLNRVAPQLPAGLMKTHLILAPPETHWRKATCAEVDCQAYLQGWGIPAKGLDAEDIHVIETSGRRWRKVEIKDGEWHYWFDAGQPCFRASTHRIRIGRPEIFAVREGDWRGNPRGDEPIVFSGADAWKNSVGDLLDQIARRR